MKELVSHMEPFERYTERYEDWFERNRSAYKSELKAVDELLPDEGEALEVGVGTGRFSEPFSVEHGIDPSLKMLKIARERGIKVVQGTGEELPFEGESFDRVLIVTTICFFEEPKKALEEAKRVLKPGGAIIIGFIDRESPIGRRYQEKKEENVFYREAVFFSAQEVTELLEDVGFKDLSYVQTLFGVETREVEEPKKGCGEGSFVVIGAKKSR